MKFAAISLCLLVMVSMLQPSAVAQYGGGTTPVCVVEVKNKAGQPVGTAGKGFAARVGGKDLFLTTAHGISGLMGTSPDPSVMFNNVGTVVFKNFANQEIGTAGACLTRACNINTYNGDLLAFELPYGSKLETMALATSLPAAGTKVWVLSKTGQNFGDNANVDRFQGVVEQAYPYALNIRMSSPLNAYHSSGSPVVNDRNEIVGMLCGTGNGRSIIGCNPSVAIYQTLTGAAPQQARGQARGQSSQSRSVAPVQNNHGVQTYR